MTGRRSTASLFVATVLLLAAILVGEGTSNATVALLSAVASVGLGILILFLIVKA